KARNSGGAVIGHQPAFVLSLAVCLDACPWHVRFRNQVSLCPLLCGVSSVYGRDRATHRRRQSNCSRLRSSSALAARVVFLRRSSDVPLAFALLARDGLEFACLARERTGCLAISIVDRKFRSWLANALVLPFSMGCDDCISPHNARAVEAAKPRRRSRNCRTHIIALVFRGRQLSRPVACDGGMAGDTADEISKTARHSEPTSSILRP